MKVYQKTGIERSGHTAGGGSLRHGGVSPIEIWYYVGALSNLGLSSGAITANAFYAMPLIAPVRRGARLDRMAYVLATNPAGNARMGIYDTLDSDGDIFPGNLLVAGAEDDTSTGTIKSHTIDLALEPGELYWVTLLSSAAPQLRIFAGGGVMHVFGQAATLGATTFTSLRESSFTYAALPAAWPATGSLFASGGNTPAFAVRFSS